MLSISKSLNTKNKYNMSGVGFLRVIHNINLNKTNKDYLPILTTLPDYIPHKPIKLPCFKNYLWPKYKLYNHQIQINTNPNNNPNYNIDNNVLFIILLTLGVNKILASYFSIYGNIGLLGSLLLL